MTLLLCLRRTIRFIIFAWVIISKMLVTYSYRPLPISKPPEIWLSSYEETDAYKHIVAEHEFRSLDQFQNIFVSKFNKTDYIITEDTNMVVFTCQAKYPVKWSFPHMKHIKNHRFYMFETTSTRLSNFDQAENQEPTNELFQTVVTIPFDFLTDIFSASLTCGITNVNKMELKRHLSRSDRLSSIHLFYAGQHVIENQGSTIEVQVVSGKNNDATSKIVLPCRPAIPTVQILLEQLIENQNNPEKKWKRLKYPTQYLNFDPKVGFIMDKKESVEDINIFGLFKCTAFEEGDDINEMDNSQGDEDDTKRQFVYVNVTATNTPKIDIENIQFQPTLNLKGDATIAYNHEVFGRQTNLSPNQSSDDSEILCCSGLHNMVPSIYSEFCIGYLQCDVLKWAMTTKLNQNISMDYGMFFTPYKEAVENHSDCSKTIFQFSPVMFCEGENVQFADHFINVFGENLLPVSKRSQRASNELLRLSTFEPETRNFDVSRKIFLMIGYPMTSKQLEEDNGELYQPSESLQLDNFGDIEYDYAELQKLRIAEYPRDHFYVGETLIPICLGWTTLYSFGAYVGINFRNGTRQIINLKEDFLVAEVHFSEGLQNNGFFYGRRQIVHKIGRQVAANKDIISMECWMPQWNNKNWDRITRNITVLEPIPPRFSESSDLDCEESVYVYLDEEGKELVWTLESGAPEAKIDVRKDGREVLRKFNDFQDIKPRDTFESLFNVTLEKDNGTTVEVGDGTTIVLRISFRKVTHEMQGVYMCTVRNIGGSVRRSFRVIVAAKGNMLVYVLFVTMMTSALLLLGLGVRHWRQRNQAILMSLRSNQT